MREKAEVLDRQRSAGLRTGRGGRLLVAAAVAAALGLVALLPLLADSPPAAREIVLVARGMTFYRTGDPTPNPAIVLRAGERVRLVLRNEDPGFTHDLVVPAWEVSTPPVRGAGVASVELPVPPHPGRYEYRCTPHGRMMRGVLEVR